MPRNQNPNMNGQGIGLPNAGAILEVQFNAAESASRMAGEACNYAISMNRTWLNLWSNQFAHITAMPKRIADIQRDSFEETLDELQQSMQELGRLTSRARDEAEASIRETAKQGDQMVQQPRSQSEESATSVRPRAA
jgi:hypothetical protein